MDSARGGASCSRMVWGRCAWRSTAWWSGVHCVVFVGLLVEPTFGSTLTATTLRLVSPASWCNSIVSASMSDLKFFSIQSAWNCVGTAMVSEPSGSAPMVADSSNQSPNLVGPRRSASCLQKRATTSFVVIVHVTFTRSTAHWQGKRG